SCHQQSNLSASQRKDKTMKILSLLLLSILLLHSVYGQANVSKIVDLSYSFDAESVYWPTAETFKLETDFDGITDNGFYYSAYRYSAAEHGGTHLDAPVHFAKGRNSVDQIPLEQLIGPGIVVDVTRQCENNPDYLITENDFRSWEQRNGKIAAGT